MSTPAKPRSSSRRSSSSSGSSAARARDLECRASATAHAYTVRAAGKAQQAAPAPTVGSAQAVCARPCRDGACGNQAARDDSVRTTGRTERGRGTRALGRATAIPRPALESAAAGDRSGTRHLPAHPAPAHPPPPTPPARARAPWMWRVTAKVRSCLPRSALHIRKRKRLRAQRSQRHTRRGCHRLVSRAALEALSERAAMPVPPRDVVAWADGARVCVVAGAQLERAHAGVECADAGAGGGVGALTARATPALTLECSEVVEAVEVDVDRRQHAGALSRGLRKRAGARFDARSRPTANCALPSGLGRRADALHSAYVRRLSYRARARSVWQNDRPLRGALERVVCCLLRQGRRDSHSFREAQRRRLGATRRPKCCRCASLRVRRAHSGSVQSACARQRERACASVRASTPERR